MVAEDLSVGESLEASLDPDALEAPEPSAESALRLRALYEIGRLVLAPREPLEILDGIVDAVLRRLGPANAALLAVAADGALSLLVARGLDLTGPVEEWAVSRTVLRRVHETGLAVLVSDSHADPLFDGGGSAHRFRIHTMLCVPLGRHPVRGMLYLDGREQGARSVFSRDDLEFLTAASFQVTPILDRVQERRRSAEALDRSTERLELLEGELRRHHIVGRSQKLLEVYDALRRFARGGARVLLRGETGTGKELFARAYAANSARATRPYVPVPIPALAPSLIESELFGHVKGAFTEAGRDKKGRLEMADGGVLFLDEVGDIEPALQPKLLRFLDSGELYRVGETAARRVDALVVSATNRPLERMVEDGRLRDDLLARLGQTLVLPPLRERPEDIPLLVDHFLAMHQRGGRRWVISPEALELMQSYRWEFNIRQLQQVVEYVVCLVEREMVGPEDLPDFLRGGAAQRASPRGAPAPDPRTGPPAPLRQVVEAVEREHLARALEYTGGNKRRAIELLQIAPETFYRRLEEFGLRKRRS